MQRIFLALFTMASCSIAGTSNMPMAMAQEIPKAQCIQNSFGQQLCGYNCIQNNFGQMACADWSGGKCIQNDFGQQKCGPPAPPNWLDSYTKRPDNSQAGTYGAWAVSLGTNTGLLRMHGLTGTLVLVSGASIVEQKITLKQNRDAGYVLVGEVSATHNVSKYNADTIYIQQFSRIISTKSCDGNRCSSVNLTYLGE